MLETSYSALSEIGKVRSHNEDSYAIDESTPNGRVFVVCDGMGGHVGGAIASSLAAKSIIEYFKRQAYDNLINEIVFAMQFANEQIFVQTLADPSLKGMGTTAVVLIIKDDNCYIGHVGDSRIYLKTDGKLHRLTKDHSFVQTLVDSGAITDEDAERHPQKNQILKALGHSAEVKATVCQSPIKVQAKDVFLLCSDGLNGMINDRVIEDAINPDNIELSKHNLYNLAMDNGGADNVTVMLVKVEKSSHYKHSVFQSFNPKKAKSYEEYDKHTETNAVRSDKQQTPVYIAKKDNKKTIMLASLITTFLIVAGILVYFKFFSGNKENEKDGGEINNVMPLSKSELDSKNYVELVELSKSKPNVLTGIDRELTTRDNKKVKLEINDSDQLVGVIEIKTGRESEIENDDDNVVTNNDKKDSDGDGFPDKIDNCPNVKGTNKGCPASTQPVNKVPADCAKLGLKEVGGGYYTFPAAASGNETAIQFASRVTIALGTCGFTCNISSAEVDNLNTASKNKDGNRVKSTFKGGALIKFKRN